MSNQPETSLALDVREMTHRFKRVVALDRCNLSIAQAEVVALLGPSGCGKTTLLNMIAGFGIPDYGDVLIGDVRVTHLPAWQRNVAMVFQSYALFPHMTVAQNVGYGLRARKAQRSRIAGLVAYYLDLVQLSDLPGRYPSELSAGQQQRVALARALATEPRVLLLDEAFNALDKNLRAQMQVEIPLLLRRQGITTLFVTHDHEEAFTLADRIAIMDTGRIVQTGSPEEVYRRPRNRFVMEFLGSPNRIPVSQRREVGGEVIVFHGGGIEFILPNGGFHDARWLYIRPQVLHVSCGPTAVHPASPARVELTTFQAESRHVVLSLGALQLRCEVSINQLAPKVGDLVYVDFNPEHAYLMPD